jgi:hypothetical protein
MTLRSALLGAAAAMSLLTRGLGAVERAGLLPAERSAARDAQVVDCGMSDIGFR